METFLLKIVFILVFGLKTLKRTILRPKRTHRCLFPCNAICIFCVRNMWQCRQNVCYGDDLSSVSGQCLDICIKLRIFVAQNANSDIMRQKTPSKRLMRGTMQAVPRLALLLYAISPVTETKEWMFYANSAAIICLFLMSIIYAIHIYKKDKKEGLKILIAT